MSKLDDIRARVGNIEPEDMSLHEQDRAFLLDLVERAKEWVEASYCFAVPEGPAAAAIQKWLKDMEGQG